MLFAPAILAAHVVLWHAYRGEEERALEHVVKTWNQTHPDETVDAVAVPYDAYSQKLSAAIPRGNGPDLFIAAHERIGDWRASGLIQQVPESADDDGYLPETFTPLHDGGKLFALPLAFKSLALFYRRDQLAQPPDTTDELIAFARQKRGAGKYGFAYETADFFYHAAWLHGFGGKIFDDGIPRLDSPEAIRSVEFVLALDREHLVPGDATHVLIAQLFNEGNAAMTIAGPWFTGEIAPGVDFGVARLPIVSETGKRAAPLLSIESVFLAARAASSQAALRFAHFLTGADGARIRAIEGRQTVAARAVWDDPRVKDDPILGAFYRQLPDTIATPSVPAMALIWEPVQNALRKVLRGAATPAAALHDAQARIMASIHLLPTPVSPLPYAIALGVFCLVALIYLSRRAASRLGQARKQRAAYAYLAPAAISMAILVFVPFAVGASMSLYHHQAGRFTFIGLQNFISILSLREIPITDPLSFYFTLGVTILWTVANVTLHVILGVSLALLLRNPLLKLRGVYRVLLIIPWAVPNYITALIWKGMFHRQFGAINGLLSLFGIAPVSWFSHFATSFAANLATNVWLGFPFMMVVTLGALSRIPKELEEAAALDGASAWERLRHIILPLLRPALLPSVILGAVWTFNMFNIVFLVSGGEPDGATDILVSQAYRWAFVRGSRYGYAAAYAVLIFLVLVIWSALARRLSDKEAEA